MKILSINLETEHVELEGTYKEYRALRKAFTKAGNFYGAAKMHVNFQNENVRIIRNYAGFDVLDFLVPDDVEESSRWLIIVSWLFPSRHRRKKAEKAHEDREIEWSVLLPKR